jgi:hypothetical protein
MFDFSTDRPEARSRTLLFLCYYEVMIIVTKIIATGATQMKCVH